MKPRADMDISGQDIPCKSNQFCQVCGSVEDVKNACMQDNRWAGDGVKGGGRGQNPKRMLYRPRVPLCGQLQPAQTPRSQTPQSRKVGVLRIGCDINREQQAEIFHRALCRVKQVGCNWCCAALLNDCRVAVNQVCGIQLRAVHRLWIPENSTLLQGAQGLGGIHTRLRHGQAPLDPG